MHELEDDHAPTPRREACQGHGPTDKTWASFWRGRSVGLIVMWVI